MREEVRERWREGETKEKKWSSKIEALDFVFVNFVLIFPFFREIFQSISCLVKPTDSPYLLVLRMGQQMTC